MKRTFVNTIIFITVFAFLSCSNDLLMQPSVKSANDPNTPTGSWGAPDLVTATHGQKRQVTLSWQAVRGAVKYRVESADSPFSEFKLIKDTVEMQTMVAEKASVIKYYKVFAVDRYGKSSDASKIAIGSTLAVPQIVNISKAPDEESSSLILEWLMPNLNTGTSVYEDHVTYTILYTDASGVKKEAGKIPATIGGAVTQFKVTGLNALTDYYFMVQSSLSSEPSVYEESLRVNMETAQKMKPDKPKNLVIEQGLHKDAIKLTWICPGNVQLPKIGEDTYVSTPLFFKVYRKKSGTMEYALIKEIRAASGAVFTEGDTIVFDDTFSLEDAQYDYKVQSFADDAENPSTSTVAIAEASGWRIRPIQKFMRTVTNNRDEANNITGVSVTFQAQWSNFGNEAPYTVVLLEEKSGSDSSFPTISSTATIENVTFVDGVLTEKTTNQPVTLTKSVTAGRADYYRYTLKIKRERTDILTATSASVVVAEVQPPHAEFNTVTDGYVNTAHFTWNYQQGTDYKLRVKSDNATNDHNVVFGSDQEDGKPVFYNLTGLVPNTDYEIALVANNGGVENVSNYCTVTTLGIPEVVISDYNSKTVTLTWKPVKSGHSGTDVTTRPTNSTEYTLGYQKIIWANNNFFPIDEQIDISALQPESDGTYKYVLNVSADHYTDGFASGKEFKITVAAKSAVSQENTVVKARLVGPAEAGVIAGQAASAESVAVTWNAISRAKSYYIDRESVSDAVTDRYLIEKEHDTWTAFLVDVAEGNKKTQLTVEKTGNSFTFKDAVQPKVSVEMLNGKPKNYSDRQATLSWDKQYTYSVIPISETGDEVDYTKIAKKEGYVLGYAKNIHATKAKFSKKVTVTWEHPKTPSGQPLPQYKVYRKAETGTEDWTALFDSYETGTSYEDNSAQNLQGYKYLVVANNKIAISDPCKDAQFEKNFKTESFAEFNITNEAYNVGYIMPAPQFTPTRKELVNPADPTDYGIAVNWEVAVSDKRNRGVNSYKIEIQNNNIDSAWRPVVQDIVANKLLYEDTFYTKQARMTPETGKNLLKVLRDYKINFRITAIGDGVEASGENWGARQITDEEFVKSAMLVITQGFYNMRGGSYPYDNNSHNDGVGGTLNTYHIGLSWAKPWFEFTFNNYSPEMNTPSGVKNRFLKVSIDRDAKYYFYTASSNGYTTRFEYDRASTPYFSITGPTIPPADNMTISYAGNIYMVSNDRNHIEIKYRRGDSGNLTQIVNTTNIDERRRWFPLQYTGDGAWWHENISYGWWN